VKNIVETQKEGQKITLLHLRKTKQSVSLEKYSYISPYIIINNKRKRGEKTNSAQRNEVE
jgi:hypothetical protein